MDIDNILASDAAVAKGGVRGTTERGDAVYDLPALTEVLRVRCAGRRGCGPGFETDAREQRRA